MSAPGSIRKAYEACCAATGRPAQSPPRIGTLIRCPFHSDKTPSFSLREDTETFNCFGACGQKGGVFALVVAFGVASDFSEASKWLADRGIVAAAVKQGTASKSYEPAAAYTDHLSLDDELRTIRMLALLDLEEAIGPVRLRLGRDQIAIYRYQREVREEAQWSSLRTFVHSTPEITEAVISVLSHPHGYDVNVRAEIWKTILPRLWPKGRVGRCPHGLVYGDACLGCERSQTGPVIA